MIIGKFFLRPDEMKDIVNSDKITAEDAIIDYYKNKDEDSYYYALETLKDKEDFKVIVESEDELDLYMNFFSKHKVKEGTNVKFRTHKINSMEIYDVLQKYLNQEFTKDIMVNVDNGYEMIDYNKFIKMMNPLIGIDSKLVDELSQLEKIMLIYNEIKKNAYKNNVKNPNTMESRLLSEVLTNEEHYIVCVGFTKFFNESLRLNDIKCTEYNFKGKYKNQDIGHSVSFVNIDDDKYDIHGIYVFDLTQDCYDKKLSEEENSMRYKGFMMSFNEFSNKYNVYHDNYLNLLYNSEKKNKLYAKDKENKAKNQFVRIFDNNEMFEQLSRFVELDYDLFDGVSNIDVNENLLMQESMIYNYTEFLKSKMGEEVPSNSDKFIDLIYNTSTIKDDHNYLYKSVISRGVTNHMDTFNKVKKKI